MPATKESPDERRRLCAELWTSFTALIRSYVAAHDLAMPAANHSRVVEEAGRLFIQAERKIMALDFDPAQGSGKWAVYQDGPDREQALERGGFEMDSNSQVAMSDRHGKLELEVAAEAFTAKVFD